ncbi:DegT/DnrJ/EryC1/StrS family aminotransferase [bacterium]|nr:DegT/DnrJ/EryC1/StrS family aminotransferase [bacterium]
MKYKVPFINYSLQYQKIKKEIDDAFHRIMESGDLIYREDMVKFEKDIASFVGKNYGIGTGSCTGALFLSLYANGIGPGDEVITVDHTYIATIDVIIRTGASPVLIDIRDDFNMDPDLIEEAITDKTKAIIPVHLNGRCCEMDKIMEIAQKYNLLVIEDAAQALGAKYNGAPAGSFGKTSCFSFYPAKLLGSYGEGGMVCTDDEQLAERLYLLRDHGEKPSYLKTEEEKQSKDSKIHCWGFNTILDNLQAAFLNVKLKYFPEWIKRRREIASFYNERLSGVGDLILPPAPEEEGRFFDVFQNYVIRSKQRDSLAQYLQKEGIETLIKWKTPNYRQENLKELHYFNLPKTDQISREVLSLPIYPELEDKQIEYVVDCVRKFFSR